STTTSAKKTFSRVRRTPKRSTVGITSTAGLRLEEAQIAGAIIVRAHAGDARVADVEDGHAVERQRDAVAGMRLLHVPFNHQCPVARDDASGPEYLIGPNLPDLCQPLAQLRRAEWSRHAPILEGCLRIQELKDRVGIVRIDRIKPPLRQ